MVRFSCKACGKDVDRKEYAGNVCPHCGTEGARNLKMIVEED